MLIITKIISYQDVGGIENNTGRASDASLTCPVDGDQPPNRFQSGIWVYSYSRSEVFGSFWSLTLPR